MLSGLVWKDPRVLRAADSHRPAQMLLNPGSSGTTDTACSAAVSLMRFQVQSLSLLRRPTGTTQRQIALFLTKRFPVPSPEARPFEGHKGLSRIKQSSVPTNVSAIQTTSSWLSPLGLLCRASVHYAYSMGHVKELQMCGMCS